MTEYNLASLLSTSADTHPDRTAIIIGTGHLSYSEPDAPSSQVGQLLSDRGVGRSDAVALLSSNVPAFTWMYFDILNVGATEVPLNVLLKAVEISYPLQDSGPGFCRLRMHARPADVHRVPPVLRRERRSHGILRHHRRGLTGQLGAATETLAIAQYGRQFGSVRTDEEDVAVYTSAITSQPKCAELRHRSLRDNALAACDFYKYPSLLDIVENLPVTAPGTILKPELS